MSFLSLAKALLTFCCLHRSLVLEKIFLVMLGILNQERERAHGPNLVKDQEVACPAKHLRGEISSTQFLEINFRSFGAKSQVFRGYTWLCA